MGAGTPDGVENLTIRFATADELDDVRSSYRSWGYSAGAHPEDLVYRVEVAGRIVAQVRRTEEEASTLMLRGMYVAPEWRGKGIGARLLAAFARDLHERGCLCIPYAHLVHFYGREGFEVVNGGEGPAFLEARLASYRSRGMDVVLMRRSPVIE